MTLSDVVSLTPGACSHKGCPHDATNACQRCGHGFCSAHLQSVTLERRIDERQGDGRQRPLTRQPTSKTTYIVCSACRNKPLHERMLHPNAPTSSH